MGSEPRARRRQRARSRAAAAESARRGRQIHRTGEVRPMPFPAPADTDAMDPEKLGEEDRLDAGTRSRKARYRRSDGPGNNHSGGLSGEELLQHHAKSRSEWPLVENPAA